jgi:DNA-binding NtrC family response regulator
LELQKKKPALPRQLYTLLSTHDFPGNVRELKNMVFDAMSRHDSGILSMDSFKAKIHHGNKTNSLSIRPPHEESRGKIEFCGTLPTLKEAQEILISEALKTADGNQTIAAGILGMSRRALSARLSRQ